MLPYPFGSSYFSRSWPKAKRSQQRVVARNALTRKIELPIPMFSPSSRTIGPKPEHSIFRILIKPTIRFLSPLLQPTEQANTSSGKLAARKRHAASIRKYLSSHLLEQPPSPLFQANEFVVPNLRQQFLRGTQLGLFLSGTFFCLFQVDLLGRIILFTSRLSVV